MLFSHCSNRGKNFCQWLKLKCFLVRKYLLRARNVSEHRHQYMADSVKRTRFTALISILVLSWNSEWITGFPILQSPSFFVVILFFKKTNTSGDLFCLYSCTACFSHPWLSTEGIIKVSYFFNAFPGEFIRFI